MAWGAICIEVNDLEELQATLILYLNLEYSIDTIFLMPSGKFNCVFINATGQITP